MKQETITTKRRHHEHRFNGKLINMENHPEEWVIKPKEKKDNEGLAFRLLVR